jgi:hypothetical protein
LKKEFCSKYEFLNFKNPGIFDRIKGFKVSLTQEEVVYKFKKEKKFYYKLPLIIKEIFFEYETESKSTEVIVIDLIIQINFNLEEFGFRKVKNDILEIRTRFKLEIARIKYNEINYRNGKMLFKTEFYEIKWKTISGW